jgi:hypothetical protein
VTPKTIVPPELGAKPVDEWANWLKWRDEEISSWILSKAFMDGHQYLSVVNADVGTEEFIPCTPWRTDHDGKTYEFELIGVVKRKDGRRETFYTITEV